MCHDWLIDGLFMKNQCGGVKAVHLPEDGCPAVGLAIPRRLLEGQTVAASSAALTALPCAVIKPFPRMLNVSCKTLIACMLHMPTTN